MSETAARRPPLYTNRYLCPITGCNWHHNEHVHSDGVPWAPWQGSIEETVFATCIAQPQVVERSITDHVSTHPVLEWFREVRSQQDRADLAERERDEVRARLAEAATLLGHFVDHEDQPCRFDHHGGCQEHGGSSLRPCDVAVGRELLARIRGGDSDAEVEAS